MSNLIEVIDNSFNFNNATVRIIGSFEEPRFVAKDVCSILGLSNVTEALRHIPEKWRSSEFLSTPSGKQNTNIINEAGLYKLIMRSNKAIATKFQEWVCGEVLPSLRKKGEYKMNEEYQLKLKALEDEKNNMEQEKLKIEDVKNTLEEKLNTSENEKQKLTDLLYRKKTDFKKGTCIYVGKNSVEEDFKVGNSVNAPNRRIGLSSGTTTDFVMENCWYTKYSKIIEDTVKIKFAKYRVVHRKEFYKKESHDDIVYFISSMVDFFEKVDEDDDVENIEEEISTVEVPKLYKNTKESDYIVIRKIDGYIHLPSICKYFDRTYNAYAHSTRNKDYLEEQVRINPEIIRYSTGANKELQGSWGAPIIAIHLANWISSDIGERVSKYIEEQKENIEDKPEKIGFTMRELMSTTNKKEELQQLSKALGLACGLSRTKRQMSDYIFNYLENCEVFVDTAKKYFKTCDKCKEMKSLDTENFIRQHEVGFMHTCKGCLEVSFEKSTVSEVVEKDVEVKQGEKFCNGCKTVKKSEQFHKNGSRISAYCTPCMSAYRKEQRLRAKI